MNLHLAELGHARAVAENQQSLGGNLQEDLDFIVCGAGSAGRVVAARLAEQLDAKVLLLEASHGVGFSPTSQVATARRCRPIRGLDRPIDRIQPERRTASVG
jgi:flavin-dependent dehydrogenase